MTYPERDSNSHFSELKSDASSCWAIGAVYDRTRTYTLLHSEYSFSAIWNTYTLIPEVGFEPTLSASLMLYLCQLEYSGVSDVRFELTENGV